jgi:hypothetical protein
VLTGVGLFASHPVFYHGNFDDVEILLSHTDRDRLNVNFASNYVFGPPVSVFYRGEMEVKYERGYWYEFVLDTPFTWNGEDNLLVEFRYDGCDTRSLYNLDWWTGTFDRVVDGYIGIENGFLRERMPALRFTFDSLTTVSTQMTCSPHTGTLPFTSAMTVNLVNNRAGETRTLAGRIDVTLANGQTFTNWRTRVAELAPGGWDHNFWSQPIPAYSAFVGESVFRLVVEDVTPAPYNQPPYAAAGDRSTRTCIITGHAPE